MWRSNKSRRGNPAKLSGAAIDWGTSARRERGGIAASKAAASGRQVNSELLLGHLQAENAHLRDTAARLALEIQQLRQLSR